MNIDRTDLYDFLDHEGFIEGKKPSLKAVFDNLRNYPLLALLFAAVSLMGRTETLPAKIAQVFWAIVIIGLLLLSAFQTAIVLIASLAYFFPSVSILKSRKLHWLLPILASIVFIVGTVSGMELFNGLRSLRVAG